MSSSTSIVVMVVDRANIAAARKLAEKLEEPTDGSGWTQGLNVFEAMDNHQYLFMLADDVARCIHAAPQVMSMEHLQNLYAVVSGAAETIEGQAMWMTLVKDKEISAEIRKIVAQATQAAPELEFTKLPPGGGGFN